MINLEMYDSYRKVVTMKKLALFAMLCVSVIGFSVGCSDAGGEAGGDAAPAADDAGNGNGDAAEMPADGSDTSAEEAPAEEAPAE